MKKVNKILYSVLDITKKINKNQITAIQVGHFRKIYYVNPNDEKIEGIVVAGASLESYTYVVKIRMKDPFLKDEFFGNNYYEMNKNIFEQVDNIYNQILDMSNNERQVIIIG